MIDWAAERFRPQLDESWQELTGGLNPIEHDSVMKAMDSSRSGPAVLAADYFCHAFRHIYRDLDATPMAHFLAHCGPMASNERAFFERLAQTRLRAFRVISVANDNIEIVDIIERTGPRLRVFCSAANFEMQDRLIARLIQVNDCIEFAMVLHLNLFDTKYVQDAFALELKYDPTLIALNSIQSGKAIRGRAPEHDAARALAQGLVERPDLMASLPEQIEEGKAHVLQLTLYELWLDDLLQFLKNAQRTPQMIFAGTGEPLELHEDDYDILDHPELLHILHSQIDVEISDASAPISATRATLLDGKIPEAGRPRTSINFDGAHKLSLFHHSKGQHQIGKAWFESIAGHTVRFRQTRITNPSDSFSGAPSVAAIGAKSTKKDLADQAELMKNPEIHNAVIALVKKQYATWATDQIPALNNKTPTQLMASKAGRDKVRALLLSYEQGPRMGIPIDFQFLWDELRLARVE
jgi:hypothetical protein